MNAVPTSRTQKRILAFAAALAAGAVAIGINLATGVEYDYAKLSVDEWLLRFIIAMVNIYAIAMVVRAAIRPVAALVRRTELLDDVAVWVFGLSVLHHLFFWPWATYVDFIVFPFGSAVLSGRFVWMCLTIPEKRARFAATRRRQERAGALEGVDTVWLLDAFNAPENTDREALIQLVATLPDGIENALKRAQRKGVKADDVAPLIAAGSFTEADADRLAREVA